MARILFVCSANKDRSRTAEDLFRKQFPNHQFDSGGTNYKICFQEGTTPLSEEQMVWADRVYAMEEKHRTFIKKTFPENYSTNIEVLNIPDRYVYNHGELVEILETKLSARLKHL